MSGIAEGLFAEQDDPRSYKKLVTVEDLIKFEDALPAPSAGGSIDANHGNTAYVSVAGNDLTGVVGNISKPFQNIGAAIAALSSIIDGVIVILSSSSAQVINDYDYTTMPYNLSIFDYANTGLACGGSCSFGNLKVRSAGVFMVATDMLYTSDDYCDIQCDTLLIQATAQGAITFLGAVECNTFSIPSNTNSPSLTFDRIIWKNTLDVNQPITYNRCNPMVWKGLVKQNGTSAPIATVVDNSTGETLVFSYEGAGLTKITSPGAKFGSATKTTLNSSPAENNGGTIFPHLSYQVASASEINLECYDAVGFALGDFLGTTVGTLIEIEVYP